MLHNRNAVHSVRKEYASVLVLALGFGLVGIDRFLISTLFPVIAADLSLTYTDIGTITGALAISWGIAALFMGNLSDRIGRRTVLVGSLILFSALIGASGLAGGLASLVLVRVMMGFADGAYTPASITATMDASPEHRRGRNIGLQQMTALLFGLGIAPLVISGLLDVINWRWIFALFVLPGFLLAWVTWKVLPPHSRTESAPDASRSSLHDWRRVVAEKNIKIGMGLMLCWLTVLVAVSAFLPNYMLDHLQLDFQQMGTVMSAIGFGGALGSIVLPWMSDRLGRKRIFIAGSMGVTVALVLLSLCGPNVIHLYACLFVAMFGVMALITLTVGPLCVESVPLSLTATASGVVIATGEIFGGGIAPIIVGSVAHRAGIEYVLVLPVLAMLVAFIASFFVAETAPAKRQA